MEESGSKTGSGFWSMIANFKGDKVIWMIVLMLMMFSLLSVFSSTSLLAQQMKTDRLAILKEQILTVALGLGVIWVCYRFVSIRLFETLSQFGFILSLALLVILVGKLNLGFIKSAEINGAQRILKMFGFQIHVYEIVKVAMVMYLAWAVNAFKEDRLWIANYLAGHFKKLEFLASPLAKKIIYIYLPIFITTALILVGGTSSALFIGGIMILTIFVGGVDLKEILILGLFAVLYLGSAVALDKFTDGKVVLSERIHTALHRLNNDDKSNMEILLTEKKNSKKFQDAADQLKQPVSAMIAIKEGGVFGKGPGGSTQRYVVPVIFGDYMFSFIVEEYGLLGALMILLLYSSLIPRGALLAKNCDNYYGKVVLAGLTLTISLQAFMHICINVHLVPQTGQTLPLISHGTSSFLAFCIAFGVILSISRAIHANPKAPRKEEKTVQEETGQTEPLEYNEI